MDDREVLPAPTRAIAFPLPEVYPTIRGGRSDSSSEAWRSSSKSFASTGRREDKRAIRPICWKRCLVSARSDSSWLRHAEGEVHLPPQTSASQGCGRSAEQWYYTSCSQITRW